MRLSSAKGTICIAVEFLHKRYMCKQMSTLVSLHVYTDLHLKNKTKNSLANDS